MQAGSSDDLIKWKSGKTAYVPLWGRMEGAWLWTLEISLKEINANRFFQKSHWLEIWKNDCCLSRI
jgi:hypothetical protein